MESEWVFSCTLLLSDLQFCDPFPNAFGAFVVSDHHRQSKIATRPIRPVSE